MSSTKRICIYPKDIMRVTGKSERYARTLLTKIKNSLEKSNEQLVSISEFCSYTGLKPAEVINLIA
jgi:hypothetical protein